MKDNRLYTLLAALWITLAAQAFGEAGHWIGCPVADSTQQVLFRRTYVFRGCPRTARITLASSGRQVVYVNGYNVSADVLEPGVAPVGGSICTKAYEVGRYLQADSNTVAVWYSPAPPCRATSGQIALTMSGTGSDGRRFAYATDESWLCRPAACATLPDGRETADGGLADSRWHQADFIYPLWQGAARGRAPEALPRREIPRCHTALRMSHVYTGRLAGLDGQRAVYRFPRPFNGWVRLTLRGMEPGATLEVNGLRYLCSGETDEQACRRFTTLWQDAAEVTLPCGATPDNIQTVEGIEISPYQHTSWRY